MRTFLVVLLGIVILASPVLAEPGSGSGSAPSPQVQADEKLLTDAGLKHDGAALMDYLRKRTGNDEDPAKVSGLLPRLADEKFAVRWQASEELKKLGLPTVGQIRRVGLVYPDEETRDQCQLILAKLEKNNSVATTAAVARLLRERKPVKAMPVILQYLPFAQDDEIEQELIATIVESSAKEAKLDPALIEALKDKLPARQAVAAMLMGRFGSEEEKKAVGALLKAEDTGVRLRAAQGLIAGKEKDAVAVLVSLLTEGTLDQANQAEDLLTVLAGNQAPKTALGYTSASRKKCQELWAAWWKNAEAKFDLTKFETDLTPLNPNLRFREVMRKVYLALNNGDHPALCRYSDVPFTYLGSQVCQTVPEMENYWASMIVNFRSSNMTFGIGSITNLDEYLRVAQPHEREHIAKLPKNEIRVLHLTTFVNGQYQPGSGYFQAIFLRVRGTRVQVVALGASQVRPR